MSLTNAQVQQAYVTFFSRAADTAGLNYWTQNTATSNLANLYSAFSGSAEYTSAFAGLTNGARVELVYNNLFGRSADISGLNYWTLQLDTGAITLPNLALALAAGAQGTDATTLANRVTAATAYTNALDTSDEVLGYSGDTANAAVKAWLNGITDTASLTAATSAAALAATVTSTISAAAVAGSTFTLTTSANVVTGTSGDDTFSGTAGTIDGDVLAGGAGTDTLNLTVTVADDDASAFQATDIETISLRSTGGTANDAALIDLEFGDVSGLDTLEFRRINDDIQVANLQSLDTTIAMSNNATAADVVVGFEAAVVAGSADTANVTIDATTGGADLTINGVETIAVTAVGSDNDINLDGDDLETVTVAGAGDISIDVDASVTTFDASSNTGGVTMVATAAANVTATGGAGNDTFSMGITLTANDTIDGGDGTDTLIVNNTDGNALTVIPASAAVSNVETLRIEATDDSAADAFTLDANVVSFDTITIDVSDENDTYTITDYTSETLNVVESLNNAVALLNVSLADATGSADSLTVNVTNNDATTALTVTDINSTGGGIETLNLVANQGADIADASDIVFADISSTHSSGVNISGDADVTIGSGTSFANTTLNTSALTGDLTASIGAATSTITLGNGTNTVTFDAAAYTSADTVIGGTGADTVVTGNLAAGVANATLTGVETVRANFGTGSAGLSLLGAPDVTRLDMQGDEAHSVTNLSSLVSTVNIASTDADGGETVAITYTASTNAAHTVTIGDVVDGTANADVDVDTITISGNAGALTIVSDGAAGNSTDRIVANATTDLTVTTTEDLEIDAADGGTDGDLVATAANTVTVNTAGGVLLVDGAQSLTGAETLSFNAADGNITFTGAMTATAAETLTVTAADDFLQTGDFVSDADVTSVDLTATGASASIIYDGVLDVDHVRTINLTAAGGGTVRVDDIELLGVDNDDTTNITTALNISATGTDVSDNGSTVTVGALNTAQAATLDSITITGDGDSTVSVTTGGASITVTDIDASGMAGGLTLDGSTVAALLDIVTGTGTSVLSLEEGLAHTVSLGSGTDTINLLDDNEGTSAAMVVTGFETGSDGDVISIDVSDIDGADAVGAENELGTALGVATSVIMQTDADGTLTAATGASIFKLTDVFANVAAVVAAMDGNLTGFATTDDAVILVLWSDGANSYLSAVQDNGGNGAGIDGGENLIQFVGTTLGTSNTTGLTVDNFAFV